MIAKSISRYRASDNRRQQVDCGPGGSWKRIKYRLILVVFLLIVTFATSVVAQEATEEAKQKHRRWTLAVHIGFSSGGPAGDIEALMTTAGFDKTTTQPFGLPGAEDHPYSLTGLDFQSGAPWMVSVNFLHKSPFSLGIVVGDTPIGTTFGFHAAPDLDLNLQYSTGVLAPIFSLQAADVLRLGIGPAIYYPQTGTTSLDTEDQGNLKSKSGFLLDFGLTLPSKSHLFLELRVQYRSVGSVTIGPFERGIVIKRTVPAGQVDYDHWLFGLGFGFGF
jgi:hypothetical protein